jgi:hypothetical protein
MLGAWLRQLRADSCRALGDTGLRALAGLARLHELSLRGCAQVTKLSHHLL